MKRYTVFLFLLLLAGWRTGEAQSSYPFHVAIQRLLWHEKVDRQQKRLEQPDGSIRLVADPSVNLQVADALLRRVDVLQQKIEEDSLFSGQVKVKYLRSLEQMLLGFNNNWRNPDFSAALAPGLVTAFEACMKLDEKGESIEPVIRANPYGIGKILVDCFLYPEENPGVAPSRNLLTLKYCHLHPDKILPVLSNQPYLPFTDSLITVAAHYDVQKLYDYAQAHNTLGNRIRSHPDSLVHLVARIAASRSGQLYFPFLDDLLRGKITLGEIDSVKDNVPAYFNLMVKTRIEYMRRMLPPLRDTATEWNALNEMMTRKAKDYFIREINALHTVENTSVRFRRLDGLSAQELYYICILGEDELYTSSYLLGVYPRIWQQMANPRGDSLLMSVHGDHFRKFIKMAAGYNELNDLLNRMDSASASSLMQAFVVGLERTKGEEESVDVADSYSSIMEKNPELAKFVLDVVKWSYQRNLLNGDKRGAVIYKLLEVLFESADTTNQSDISAKLGLPPVYSINYKDLEDDSGRVVQQLFFYGDEDKDGQKSFASFMAMFRGRPEWRITENDDWVTIKSTRGKPIWIFANKPKLGEDDPDEKAAQRLCAYLEKNHLKPSIVIHRGHSYHLESTLEKLQPSARIVVLGSCGGYNNLSDVLTISPGAHIISSKQTGSMTINDPILGEMNSILLAGKDIDWITMWEDLSSRFRRNAAAEEKFEDYIPPYKNLGAIFIKAYRKAMGEQK